MKQSKDKVQTIPQSPSESGGSFRQTKKMQLWSNHSKSEYAIRLEGRSEFPATTSQNAKLRYTELIDESYYLEDFEYDWDYTLRHWIKNYACDIVSEINNDAWLFTHDNVVATGNTNGTKPNSFVVVSKSSTAERVAPVVVGDIYDNSTFKSVQKDKHIKMYKPSSLRIGTFGCNYCKLKFSTRTKRRQHEQGWHNTTKPMSDT
jgi:hypothetical protein